MASPAVVVSTCCRGTMLETQHPEPGLIADLGFRGQISKSSHRYRTTLSLVSCWCFSFSNRPKLMINHWQRKQNCCFWEPKMLFYWFPQRTNILFQIRESSYDNNKCTCGSKVTCTKSIERSNSKKNPNLSIFKLHLKLYLRIYLVASHCMTVIKPKNHSSDIIFCITWSEGSPQFIRV